MTLRVQHASNPHAPPPPFVHHKSKCCGRSNVLISLDIRGPSFHIVLRAPCEGPFSGFFCLGVFYCEGEEETAFYLSEATTNHRPPFFTQCRRFTLSFCTRDISESMTLLVFVTPFLVVLGLRFPRHHACNEAKDGAGATCRVMSTGQPFGVKSSTGALLLLPRE